MKVVSHWAVESHNIPESFEFPCVTLRGSLLCRFSFKTFEKKLCNIFSQQNRLQSIYCQSLCTVRSLLGCICNFFHTKINNKNLQRNKKETPSFM